MASLRVVLLAASLSLPAGAFGQQRPRPAPQRVQEIDIEDGELIRGTLDGPDGELLEETQAPHHAPLIRTRGDFKDKALQSIPSF